MQRFCVGSLECSCQRFGKHINHLPSASKIPALLGAELGQHPAECRHQLDHDPPPNLYGEANKAICPRCAVGKSTDIDSLWPSLTDVSLKIN